MLEVFFRKGRHKNSTVDNTRGKSYPKKARSNWSKKVEVGRCKGARESAKEICTRRGALKPHYTVLGQMATRDTR